MAILGYNSLYTPPWVRACITNKWSKASLASCRSV